MEEYDEMFYENKAIQTNHDRRPLQRDSWKWRSLKKSKMKLKNEEKVNISVTYGAVFDFFVMS